MGICFFSAVVNLNSVKSSILNMTQALISFAQLSKMFLLAGDWEVTVTLVAVEEELGVDDPDPGLPPPPAAAAPIVLSKGAWPVALFG